MPYIDDEWLSVLMGLPDAAELDEAMRRSDNIEGSILHAMQIARNLDVLREIDGLGHMAFEPGHCWNEFCQDPDGIVLRERLEIRKVLGPKIETMIRKAYESPDRLEIDELSAQLYAFLDHPVINPTESDYTHLLEDGSGLIFLEFDGFAPRAHISRGLDPWRVSVDDQPEPDM